ncbi:MAG: trypsin-like peptidase domain-containing protein [Gemmatimonadota bacterium]
MQRRSRYSRSPARGHSPERGDLSSEPTPSHHTPGTNASAVGGRLRDLLHRNQKPLLILLGGMLVILAGILHGALRSSPPSLTQWDIDQAVLHTLEGLPAPPSLESAAYQTIRPSVVQVRRSRVSDDELVVQGAGTGVVILDDGTILTNLHVVSGSEGIDVVFWDGTEASAEIISVRPEQDLAVIKTSIVPDDLVPATMRSSQGLRSGDRVVAVGFPFGIGPSLSAGVVSGVGREYRNPEGERVLTGLIQFDAAVNPGNSGGPLATEDGEVVGIVTAILNPSNQRVFIGIGFAVPIEEATRGIGESPF